MRYVILREPALLFGILLPPGVGLALLFFTSISAPATAAWNGLATTVAGLITAAIVTREKLPAAILGLVQAGLQLLAVYGLGVTAAQADGLLAFVALVVGLWLRQQVTPRMSADGRVLPVVGPRAQIRAHKELVQP